MRRLCNGALVVWLLATPARGLAEDSTVMVILSAAPDLAGCPDLAVLQASLNESAEGRVREAAVVAHVSVAIALARSGTARGASAQVRLLGPDGEVLEAREIIDPSPDCAPLAAAAIVAAGVALRAIVATLATEPARAVAVRAEADRVTPHALANTSAEIMPRTEPPRLGLTATAGTRVYTGPGFRGTETAPLDLPFGIEVGWSGSWRLAVQVASAVRSQGAIPLELSAIGAAPLLRRPRIELLAGLRLGASLRDHELGWVACGFLEAARNSAYPVAFALRLELGYVDLAASENVGRQSMIAGAYFVVRWTRTPAVAASSP